MEIYSCKVALMDIKANGNIERPMKNAERKTKTIDEAIIVEPENQYGTSIKSQSQVQRGTPTSLSHIKGDKADSDRMKKRNKHRKERKDNTIAEGVEIKSNDVGREEIGISSTFKEMKQNSDYSDNILMMSSKVDKKRKKKKKSSHGDEIKFEDRINFDFIKNEDTIDKATEDTEKKRKRKHNSSNTDKRIFKDGTYLDSVNKEKMSYEIASHVKKRHKSNKENGRTVGDEFHLDCIRKEIIVVDEVTNHVAKKKKKEHKSSTGSKGAFGDDVHLDLLKKERKSANKITDHVAKKKKKEHRSHSERAYEDGVNLNFVKNEEIDVDENIVPAERGKKKKKKHKSNKWNEMVHGGGIHLDFVKKEKVDGYEIIGHAEKLKKKKKKHKRKKGNEQAFEDGIDLDFIKKENVDADEIKDHVEKEKKKRHKSKKGNKRVLEDAIHLDSVKKEKVDADKIIDHVVKEKKKKKKHKSKKENERTFEDGIHLDFIKKEKLDIDEVIDHVEKEKKHVSSSSNSRINSIPGGYVNNAKQLNNETVTIQNVMESSMSHKKSHLEKVGRELHKIQDDCGKEISKHGLEFTLETQENLGFDYGVHEKKNRTKRKKEKNRAKIKDDIGDCTKSGGLKEGARDWNEISSLQNTGISSVEINCKKRKEKKTVPQEQGKTSSEMSKREILTENGPVAVQTDAKKIKNNKKRKHWESLEATHTVLNEITKKKKLDYSDMDMVRIQEFVNTNLITQKKKKKKRKDFLDARQRDVEDYRSNIENKEIDCCVGSGTRKSEAISHPSPYKVGSITSLNEAEGHSRRIEDIGDLKKQGRKECSTAISAMKDLNVEVSDVIGNSNAYANELEIHAQNIQVVDSFKNSYLFSKNEKEHFEDSCNDLNSSEAADCRDSVPERDRKRSIDGKSMKCKVRITPLEGDNYHSYGNEKVGKMNGYKLENFVTNGKATLANTTMSNPVSLKKPIVLKTGIEEIKVCDYRLKWQMSDKDKEELKKQGVEFKQGRWRAEEVRQLEDNFQSILTQNDMTSNDLVKLIEDKSKEAKKRRMDLGIYHILMGGINRPIRHVHHKLKKLINPDHFKGKWLKSEENMVLALFDKHGHDWAKISQLMGRSRDSIIHKLQRLLCGPLTKDATRAQSGSRWTADENKRLLEAIEKVTHCETNVSGEKKIDIKQISSKHIDWNSVSRAVNTRSAESCRYKWVFDLSLRKPGAEKKHWTTEQNLTFLETLSKCDEEDENDVDWAGILKDLNLSGTVQLAKRKWRTYKFMVPMYERLTFGQQLEWLTYNFIKRMREKGRYTESKIVR